ncbi:MAG: tetratricopeptide repeat protein [Melioribacteraceae bacterium]|nr:tetratricopeptide repeat protein [Melioribacteraceae bacterium]
MKKIILSLLIIITLNAQDTTKSEAFRRDLPKGKSSLHKPKYPSYPLLTSFVLQKEANSGDPFAQHELGIRLLLGRGFEADTSQAVYWISKAAGQNIPAAKFNFAIMYYNGIGVDWNPFSAYKNFKFAAESGMKESQYAYGIYFTDNFVVNKDMSKAIAWFKKAAEQDYSPAKETLEHLRRNGVDLNLSESIESQSSRQKDADTFVDDASIMDQKWEVDYFAFDSDTLDNEEETEMVEKLFSENKTELKEKLGLTNLRDVESLEDTSALGIINFAAKNGSPEALFITATAAEKGIGAEKDLVKAAFNYLRSYRFGSQKAAMKLYQLVKDNSLFTQLKSRVDKGDTDAMYTYAGLVALGIDYSLTNQQAYELLERAAEKSHIYSIIEIGLSYFNGNLVEKNREKAIEYWNRAADLGSREAEVRIAFAKINQQSDDYSDEINTLTIAANQGSVLAQAALAYCYEKGIGVDQKKSMAAKLYREAASRGSETAYNSLKSMYDELRPDEEEFKIY